MKMPHKRTLPVLIEQLVEAVTNEGLELVTKLFHAGQAKFKRADQIILINATFAVVAEEVTRILCERGHDADDIWPTVQTVLDRARVAFEQSWLATPVQGGLQ